VCPFPGVALTCVSNAAVFGLVKVLQFEAKDTPLRVNEVRGGPGEGK
jgi:NAD(P)-dependent dehydrogenase (short-subunit alcohol dehydrogenase family)